MKSIEKIIKEVLLREKDSSSTISIDDSHFFSVLLEKGNSKKLWNFVCLFVALILCVTILMSSIVFFINDVLLFQNTPKIDQAGAIISERSCKRETAIFLFGSAQMWANTGIQLNKGDEIKISYSGGFHSDVAGLKKSAEHNNILRYKWISFSKEDRENTDYRLFFNKNDDGYFGSLLYIIAGEMGVDNNVDTTNIVQVKQNVTQSVEDNGVLYLAVNDIYLTKSIIEQYADYNKNYVKRHNINPITDNIRELVISKKDLSVNQDSIDLFYENKKDTIIIAGLSFIDYFSENRGLFYQDNIGEVLVVIDIKRHISSLSWRTGLYRWTEEKVNVVLDKWKPAYTIILLSFLLLTICVMIFRKYCRR